MNELQRSLIRSVGQIDAILAAMRDEPDVVRPHVQALLHDLIDMEDMDEILVAMVASIEAVCNLAQKEIGSEDR